MATTPLSLPAFSVRNTVARILLSAALWGVGFILWIPGSFLLAATSPATPEELAQAVVALSADIPPSARTAAFLGTQRQGSGVVIDDKGLVLTIGYLILEAERVEVTTHQGDTVRAHVVGYDSQSGLGLVRAETPLKVSPLTLGDSTGVGEQSPVLVVGRQSDPPVRAAVVISRRTFAGYWEYLLEEAIFTVPPQRDYAGAALVDENLRLIGIGSLFVQDAAAKGIAYPGNMFVPTDQLKPVLSDMLRLGRPDRPSRPWLGVNVAEQFGRVIITRVTKDGPAGQAGLEQGDIVLDVAGTKVDTLESFFRALWTQGGAGVTVHLTMVQGNNVKQVAVTTRDRNQHYLRTDSH